LRIIRRGFSHSNPPCCHVLGTKPRRQPRRGDGLRIDQDDAQHTRENTWSRKALTRRARGGHGKCLLLEHSSDLPRCPSDSVRPMPSSRAGTLTVAAQDRIRRHVASRKGKGSPATPLAARNLSAASQPKQNPPGRSWQSAVKNGSRTRRTADCPPTPSPRTIETAFGQRQTCPSRI
jgi:hypothetical protein